MLLLARHEPAGAARILQSLGPIAFNRQNTGTSFLAAWLLSRSLWKLGRLGEAHAGYMETFRRRQVFDLHPEPAWFWPEFLAEASEVAFTAGRADDAALLRAQLAATRSAAAGMLSRRVNILTP